MIGILELISILVVFISIVIYYVKQKFNYWENMKVPFPKPEFPFGNIRGMGVKFHTYELFQKSYQQFKGQGPFCGMYFYTKSVVLATDLNFVKSILAQDSHNFADRGQYYNEKDDPMSAHLFNIDNPKWKLLRAKLTPTFTSGKMKMMFKTVVDVGDKFIQTLEKTAKMQEEFEIKEVISRFTTDVIGSVAFGLECHSLDDPSTEFLVRGKQAFEKPRHSGLRISLLQSFKSLGHLFKIKQLPDDVSEFFMKIVRETVDYREKNNVVRNDFMNLLIQMKNSGEIEGETNLDRIKTGKLSLEEIAAQALIFWLAGFETSSTAMTFALYELAQNQELQDKARENVSIVLKKHEGEFTYEAMMEMQYVENCINESLRKYPPVTNLTRRAEKDYKVEGTNLMIKKNQLVFIPVYAIQHDEDIFPNPEVFNPDRFTPEEISKRHNYSFLSFGLGPRNCIGLRFGIMQAKIGMALLLSNFKVELGSKTEVPLTFLNSVNIMTSKHGVYLKLTKI